MPWYSGPAAARAPRDGRTSAATATWSTSVCPVQTVVRARQRALATAGASGSGAVKVGDEVAVLPVAPYGAACAPSRSATRRSTSRLTRRSRSRSRSRRRRRRRRAARCSRIRATRRAACAQLDAMVVWMGEKPLAPGRVLPRVKHGASVGARELRRGRLPRRPDTLHRANGHGLGLNDIGRAQLHARSRALRRSLREEPLDGRVHPGRSGRPTAPSAPA